MKQRLKKKILQKKTEDGDVKEEKTEKTDDTEVKDERKVNKNKTEGAPVETKSEKPVPEKESK